MITCQFNGGLGNQMFQIAAAHSLAIDNNNMDGYLIHNSPYITNIFRNVAPLTTQPIQYALYHENGFHYTPIPHQENLMLIGFFQSEKYFKHNNTQIYELFSPPIDAIQFIQSKYRFTLCNEICSIHVRRGDYVPLANNHPPCDMNYYEQAIKLIPSHVKFLIFSDDIEWCKTQFLGDRFEFVENNSDHIDLYLMSLCNHNIIANSTFSWWGAWLNRNPNKIVIAPTIWFGPGLRHHNIKDLIPETWIKI